MKEHHPHQEESLSSANFPRRGWFRKLHGVGRASVRKMITASLRLSAKHCVSVAMRLLYRCPSSLGLEEDADSAPRREGRGTPSCFLRQRMHAMEPCAHMKSDKVCHLILDPMLTAMPHPDWHHQRSRTVLPYICATGSRRPGSQAQRVGNRIVWDVQKSMVPESRSWLLAPMF